MPKTTTIELDSQLLEACAIAGLRDRCKLQDWRVSVTSNYLEHGNALSCCLLAYVKGNQSGVVAGKEVSLASLKLPLITKYRIQIITILTSL